LFALGQGDRAERMADGQREVLRGLVREGQAQHVSRQDTPVAAAIQPARRRQREVDHPGCDDRRLPGTGARHDHVRVQRDRDRAPLVGGRFGSHGISNGRGTAASRGGGHGGAPWGSAAAGKSSLPSGHSGQSVLKSQYRHSARGSGRYTSVAWSSRRRSTSPASRALMASSYSCWALLFSPSCTRLTAPFLVSLRKASSTALTGRYGASSSAWLM